MSDKENLKSGEHKKASPVGRRKFLKVASVSAPIISTIASKPVWAGACTLSGNLSNNTSAPEDPEICYARGYTGGGWCNGHAENNGYWSYIGKNKTDSLSSLITGYSVPDVTIEEAILCNCKNDKHGTKKSGDHSDECKNDEIPSNKQGLWKQRAVAALNMLLWNELKADYIAHGCVTASKVHTAFFFPTTLANIMSATQAELEDANEGNFPNGPYMDFCSL